MGMYTAMFGRVKLKRDFTNMIIADEHGNHYFDWSIIRSRRFRKHPDIKIFGADSRYTQIGFMVAAGWEDYPFEEYATVPERAPNWCGEAEPKGLSYCNKTRDLLICTTLKDYSGTYEKFYRLLPLIAEEWDLREIYEECIYESEPDKHVSSSTKGGRLINRMIEGRELHI